jgi:hypothetical protein
MNIVSDKYDLIALHKCLLEAKFNPNPSDYDIAGSPIAARISIQTIEKLINLEGGKWEQWRQFDNHEERIKNLVTALKKRNLNHISSHEERTKFITDALAPISATNEQIQTVVEDVFSNAT